MNTDFREVFICDECRHIFDKKPYSPYLIPHNYPIPYICPHCGNKMVEYGLFNDTLIGAKIVIAKETRKGWEIKNNGKKSDA